MTLEELLGEDLERADELLGAAAHDVAKYMALTARNVDPDEIDDEALGHLLRDVSATDGRRAAWEVWEGLSREISTFCEDARIGEVDREMEELAALGPEATGEERGALVRKVLHIADSIIALRRLVRARLLEERQ